MKKFSKIFNVPFVSDNYEFNMHLHLNLPYNVLSTYKGVR